MRRVLAGCLLVVAACSGGEGSPSVVKDLSLTASKTSITVGASTQITALALDASGAVIEGAHVTWTSVTPQVLSVNAAGFATGLAAGQGTIRGAAGGKTADITIQVSNPPAVSVAFDKDALTLLLPAGTTTLVPIVKAAGGVVITNPTLFYSSDAPKVATVNQLGVVTAVAAGVATITGATEGLTGSIRITVTANATATSPKITAVTPLVAGGNAVLSGTGFATSIAGNQVLVDGIPATVTAATSTQLNITLPTGGWACEPQRTASVQVNANNEVGVATATLRVANLRTLAVGQSVVVSNASEVRCNELAGTGGTYLVSVYNPSRTMANNGVTFALRGLLDTPAARQGARGDAVATPAPRVLTPTYPAIGSRRFARWQAFGEMQRSDDAHADIMQRSMDFARRTPRRQRASLEAAIPAGGATAHQVTQLGSITALKIPNLDAQNFCSTSIAINARTAWVGAHAVIVEDTVGTLNGAPTLRGQLDSLYAVIGQEFESTMWPILTGNFGNPLAMDQQLSRTGKIVMLFSPRINTLAGGTVAGFVVSCDFFPVSQAASSNVGEYFYAIMPTSTAAGISAGTRDSWMRSIRSTIIHEAKHITAFGERFARNAEFEELWLEEGTARHAEELYGRSIYGVPWKGNTGYQASVFCDVRPASVSAPQCAGRPVLMLRHFDALYQYLQSPEPYSVLGRVAPGEATFYASAWSVVRWMIDHYATTEPAFLQGMVQGTQSGVAGLEARTGKTWEEMLGEWSLALAVDDYPGVVFQNTRLRFPTWNLRDEFRGMCVDFGPCLNPANPQNVYPVEFPLQPRALTGGAFSETVNFLNAGSFTMWSLTGPTAGPQMLEVRAVGGGEPPSQLRIAIVRVN